MPQNTSHTVNYERFPSKYFSGCDIRVYFQDILIDEITDLQFTLEEKVIPLQGYNSYTYDSIARGSRIIQGVFVTNFRRTNYIREAIKEVLSERDSDEERSWRGNYPVTDKELNKGIDAVNNQNIEDKVDKLYQYAERGWSTKFLEQKKQLEDSIWDSTQEQADDYKNEPYFEEDDIAFDIAITYGAFNRSNVHDVERKYSQQINPGTVESINNVQITGVSKIVNDDGEAIREQYTFLANDLNRN